MKAKLVLLHGWGVNSRIWDDVLPQLQATFDVLTIDLPGYGALAGAPANRDVDQLADDVLSRAPESAHWCGWSMGGMVAMAAALKQPKRIEKLSLVCTTPRFTQTDDWQHGSSDSMVENLSSQFEKNYTKALTRFLLLQLGAVTDARGYSRQLASSIMEEPKPSWESLQQGLDLLRTVDLREEVSKIAVDTQVIVGTEDHVIPAGAGRYLAASIPNATLAETKAGHVPFLSAADWFAKQIRQFSKATS